MEELLLKLHEKGIDTSVTSRDAKIVLELSVLKDGTTLGVAAGDSLEEVLATLITRFALDSKNYKEKRGFGERLSIL